MEDGNKFRKKPKATIFIGGARIKPVNASLRQARRLFNEDDTLTI